MQPLHNERMIFANERFTTCARRLDEELHQLRLFYLTRENLQDDEDDARMAAASELSLAMRHVWKAREALEGDV